MGSEWMITPFEIFITYISWGNEGKNRPILVIMQSNNNILVYPITTQYENKSDTIKAKYFKINDWRQAGLEKQSYIDTGTLVKLPVTVIKNKKPIGRLTVSDKQNLLKFLNK
jgi:hypothetical protein